MEQDFDATALAAYLKQGFENSSFKSLTELARVINSNKATVSRTLNAARQSLTNKPSKPHRQFIERICEALKLDSNRGLHLAGYSSNLTVIDDEEFAVLFYDSANWSLENRIEALENAKAIFRRYQQKEKEQNIEEESQQR